MADVGKLSLKEVRGLADSVASGYPIDPELYAKHPWIREYSQEVVREIYGEHFPAWNYQTLPVFADRWEAPVQQVTTNVRRMWAEMANDRTFDWGLTMQTVEREQIVMRYELTPERVIVYVPALIQAVLDMFGDSLSHWKSKYGKSIHNVLTRSLYEYEEEEIVADLSGLTPAIMDFRIGKKQYKSPPTKPRVPVGVFEWLPEEEEEPDLGAKPGEVWWWNKALVRDIMIGWDEKGPEAFAMDLFKRGQLAEEWTQEELIEFFRGLYKKIEEFFAP